MLKKIKSKQMKYEIEHFEKKCQILKLGKEYPAQYKSWRWNLNPGNKYKY